MMTAQMSLLLFQTTMNSTQITSNNKLSIICWNARSIINKSAELERLVINNNIDIVVLQETWLKSKHRFRLKGFNCYRADSDHPRRGLAILARESINVKILPGKETPQDNIDIMAAKIQLPQKIITLVNIYASHGHIDKLCWKKLLDRYGNQDTIITGDTNAQHVLWGSEEINTRGRALAELILSNQHKYTLMNTGVHTRITKPGEAKSAPDLTLVTSNLANMGTWSCSDDPMGSDHRLLLIEINTPCPSHVPHRPPKWRTNSADWEQYSSIIESKLDHLKDVEASLENMEEIYAEFLEAINSAASASMKKSRDSVFLKATPWWNNTCQQAVENRRQALSRYYRNSTIPNFDTYLECDKIAKEIVAAAKREAFQKFCEELSTTDQGAPSAWALLRYFAGDPLTPPSTIINVNKHKEECSAVLESVTKPTTDNRVAPPTFSNPPITRREFDSALQRKKDSAPGEDLITFIMIKQLPEIAKSLILRIFNVCITHGTLLENWKKAKVIYIKKNPRAHAVDTNSIRTLTLLSCVLKILNSILKNRIEHHAETNHVLSPAQHGFRKNHNTCSNLTELVMAVEVNRAQGLSTMCIFLDIKGAFNKVNPSKLKAIMTDRQFPDYLTEWVHRFFLNKSYSDGQNSVSGSQGIDQGSTIGPTAFNIYVSQIGSSLTYSTLSSFADDFMLFTSSASIQECRQHLAEDFIGLERELNLLNLPINYSKTKLMLFPANKNKVPFNLKSLNIITSNGDVQIVENHTYLGIVLDMYLNGQAHTLKIRERCLKDNNALKVMRGSNWGSHPDTQFHLYKAAIRAKIEYAFPIYGALDSKNIKKLQTVQNEALRTITGGVKTSPISSLHAITGIPYLSARLARASFRQLTKLYTSSPRIREYSLQLINATANKCPKNIKTMREMLITISEQATINNVYLNTDLQTNYRLDPLFNYNTIPDIPNVVKNSNLSTLEIKARSMEYINTKFPDSDVVLASDGSKTSEGVGIAFICNSHLTQTGYRVPNITSSYCAENLALLKALQHLNQHHPTCSKPLILSDSRSTLLAINGFQPGSNIPPHFQEIIALISIIKGRGSQLTIQWIPGHSQILANELADRCAKEAGLREEIDRTTLIPHTEMLDSAKVLELQINQQTHQERLRTGGHWTKEIIETPVTAPWYNGKYINIRDINIINRAIIGHGNERLFQFRLKFTYSPNCRYCGEEDSEENIKHLLLECRTFRNRVYNISPNIIQFIKEGLDDHDKLMEIANFIKSNEIQF